MLPARWLNCLDRGPVPQLPHLPQFPGILSLGFGSKKTSVKCLLGTGEVLGRQELPAY